MRILVTGLPDWQDLDIVKATLHGLDITEVIHAGSPTGVDAAVAEWCVENDVPQIVHTADPARGSTAEHDNHLAMLMEQPRVVLSFTVLDLNNKSNITPLPLTDLAQEQGVEIMFLMANPQEFPYVHEQDPSMGHVPEPEPWQIPPLVESVTPPQ